MPALKTQTKLRSAGVDDFAFWANRAKHLNPGLCVVFTLCIICLAKQNQTTNYLGGETNQPNSLATVL